MGVDEKRAKDKEETEEEKKGKEDPWSSMAIQFSQIEELQVQ